MSLPSDHARLLEAVADELAQVRQQLDGVETLVGDLTRHAPSQDRPRVLTEAQSLDVLIQRVEALSGVLRSLGGGVAPARAVAGVTLTDLAARLSLAEGEPTAPAANAGDLLLF